MIRHTLTITHSHADPAVHVYEADRFAFSHEEIDDGGYLGGGTVDEALAVAQRSLVAFFTPLCGGDPSLVCSALLSLLDDLGHIDVPVDPCH